MKLGSRYVISRCPYELPTVAIVGELRRSLEIHGSTKGAVLGVSLMEAKGSVRGDGQWSTSEMDVGVKMVAR
ncbi:hypothetical protein V6N11_020114 [Hibiscus sabdariffa]|uniref:Uncharacterized protein n=1 Tax=Hibiscus sabdariffa TaxID=183260 RepID=A0ABR2P8M7_9ROSI